MSRTHKRAYLTQEGGGDARSFFKRQANKRVRHSNVGSNNSYRKVYESWDVKGSAYIEQPEKHFGVISWTCWPHSLVYGWTKQVRHHQTPSMQALTAEAPELATDTDINADDRWLELNPEYVGADYYEPDAEFDRMVEEATRVPAGWEEYEAEEEIFQAFSLLSKYHSEYHGGIEEKETSEDDMSRIYPQYPEAFDWYYAATVQEDAVYYDHYLTDDECNSCSHYVEDVCASCVYAECNEVGNRYCIHEVERYTHLYEEEIIPDRIETIRIRGGVYIEL